MSGPTNGATERFGPYELVSLLGRGGMGEVYQAYDTGRRRTVALKRLPRHLAGDRDYEVRFRREAEVAARLTEPHIIPIHDYGEIDGQLYIDMRLIKGTDLSDVIAESGPMPAARAVGIIGQVATALAAAHAEGLVHRDVKPSNVLISTTDRGEDFVHLVDFGIVHERNSTVLTATGSTIGTVDYMAPERLQQEECDHRVDVYSLGCILYEALTGGKPFPGSSTAGKMYAHMHTPPPRPTQFRPDIPPALDGVVAMALAKNPAERYASTTDLATDAYRALSGAPPQRYAPPPGTGTVLGPGPTGFTAAAPAPTGTAPAPFTATRMSAPPQAGGPPPVRTRTTAAMTPLLPPHQQPLQQQPQYRPPPPAAQRPDTAPPPGADRARPAGRRVAPLLAVAGVVLVAIVVALVVFSRTGTTTSAASSTGAPSTAGAPVASGGVQAGQANGATSVAQAAPVPAAAGATTVVTDANGGQARVKTSTLQLCSSDALPLASGQQVSTSTISRIDVTSAGSTEESVTVTLTNGQKADGKVSYGCAVSGQTDIGPYSLDLSKITSVQIGR